MKISVIGTGYVGLVSGVCFSEFGFHVTCVDKDGDKIAKLQQHIMPIYEPGLEQLVESNRKAGRLSFSTDLPQAVANSDAVFIAVGTPSNDSDGMPDVTALNAVVQEIAKHLKGYTLVVVKSTVPVGSNRTIAKAIATANPDADFDVASNPEFLREGSAIEDFMKPDRIVAGIGAQMVYTTFESAEMIKYAANAMLAMRIAFVNEIADLCEKTGANIRDVSKGVGLDKRIGDKFLQPGPGYGGSCFPKDTLALKTMTRNAGCAGMLVSATIDSNEARKQAMTKKILGALDGSVKGKTVAVLGLTFKPGTDDMRESASLVIVPELLAKGAALRVYDPQGMKEAAKFLKGNGIKWCADAYEAMDKADALVILTEWNEFRSLDLKKVKSLLKAPLVIDLRNLYKRQDMQACGFHYVSVGRQEVIPGQPWIADLNFSDEEAA
jgi:UDPglucose 6-dehydrogenase